MKKALPDYRVRRSPNAKNVRLKITREDGLCVVVPRGFAEEKIPALLQQKKAWITDAMERVGETRRFLEPRLAHHLPDSLRLAALGETWLITYRKDAKHAGVSLRIESRELILSGTELGREVAIRKLKDWLRLRVRDGLFPLAQRLANKHRLQLRSLLVKSQRTRWASCSAMKNLSLNTKLLFLPPELVRYVMIHELCHTVHMNHTKQFWRLVASKEPGFKALDQALREAWKTVPEWVF